MEPQVPDMQPVEPFCPSDGAMTVLHCHFCPELIGLLEYAAIQKEAGAPGIVLAQVERIAETNSATVCAVFIDNDVARQVIELIKRRDRGYAAVQAKRKRPQLTGGS